MAQLIDIGRIPYLSTMQYRKGYVTREMKNEKDVRLGWKAEGAFRGAKEKTP
jgi:hypothetical protein